MRLVTMKRGKKQQQEIQRRGLSQVDDERMSILSTTHTDHVSARRLFYCPRVLLSYKCVLQLVASEVSE